MSSIQLYNNIGPKLPPELTDHIIDHLHDSFEDLCSCALVCKAWLASSRFHLLQRVCLQVQENPHCRELYDIIRQSPCIPLFVRELRLTDALVYPTRKFPKYDTVSNALRSFTRLRKLELHRLNRTVLVSNVGESIRSILALPSLVELQICHTHVVLLEHLMHMLHPQLKRLVVHGGCEIYFLTPEKNQMVEGENEGDATIERQPCLLEYLEVFSEHSFLDWLLEAQSVIYLSNLRHLNVCFGAPSDEELTMKLVGRVGSTLEHLTISSADRRFRRSISIYLGYIHHLRTLTLSTAVDIETGEYLRCVLSTLTSPNLRRVELNLVDLLLEERPKWKDFTEIDKVLNGRTFGSLCSVEIVLSKYDGGHCDHVGVLERLIHCFPLLLSRRIVEFRTISWS